MGVGEGKWELESDSGTCAAPAMSGLLGVLVVLAFGEVGGVLKSSTSPILGVSDFASDLTSDLESGASTARFTES